MSGLEQILKSAQFLIHKLGNEKAIAKIQDKLDQAALEVRGSDEYQLESAIRIVECIYNKSLLKKDFLNDYDRDTTTAKKLIIAYALNLKPNLKSSELAKWIGYGCSRQKVWECKKYMETINPRIPCDAEFLENYEKLKKQLDGDL